MNNLSPTASIRKVLNGYQILIEDPVLFYKAQQKQFNDVVATLQQQPIPQELFPADEQWEKIFVAHDLKEVMNILSEQFSRMDVPHVFKEADYDVSQD